MYTKEDFKKVWKDTTKENILNQFYYDHIEMERYKNIINELEYCIENSYAEWGYEIFYIMRKDGEDETLYTLEDVKNRIKELKEGK